jgi:hypothetical protein
VHKLAMSAKELAEARAFVASVSLLCDEATKYCNRMNFTDAQAREYMRGFLGGIVERHQLAVTTTAQGALH